MNAEKYTKKSLEAIQGAQNLAVAHNNQQIEQAHLLLALLQQDGGLIPQLLQKMGVTVESLEAAVNAEVDKLPGVTGSGRSSSKSSSSQVLSTPTDKGRAMETMARGLKPWECFKSSPARRKAR